MKLARALTPIGLVLLLGCSTIPGTRANAERKLGASLGVNPRLALGSANDFSDCMRRHILEQTKGLTMAESADHAFVVCRNAFFPGHPWPEHLNGGPPEDHPPSKDENPPLFEIKPTHAVITTEVTE